jgi:tRNA-2-methylthio-N6-dimethylallyladenosine synthase
MVKKVYLETHGCQMNVHDSEKAVNLLAGIGYELTDDPKSAELILLNTCMVREKAARKVYTRIGDLKHVVSQRQSANAPPIFGLLGCVAQAEAERVFDRCRDIKLVVGTQSLGKLPELVAQVTGGFPRAIDVRLSKDADFIELAATARETGQIAYITITEGCNKFCSYCIVPFTRGRERSRPSARILEEAQALAAAGYKEVQLLGQNVNSYGLSGAESGFAPNRTIGGESGREITFANLLELLARESGLPRIKFTTSFPKDFTRDIIDVIDRHDNLCEWIHLPAQSGSDRILRAMRRGYTRADYLERISYIKNSKKDLSITGDIIVGFPGETDQDFEQTLSLVAEVEYDGLYIFNYSPRPHTPAATLCETVPEKVKGERFQRLQEVQRRSQMRRYSRYLGRILEVLVEHESARSTEDLAGHTRCNKIVNFPRAGARIGDLVNVRITDIRANSLYGEVIGAGRD